MLLEKINTVVTDFNKDLSQVTDLKLLEEIRIKYLSRNGLVATLFEEMKTASKEEKPLLGKSLNEMRNIITSNFNEVKEKLE
ncbi:MAG: hypothetical protein ACM3O3_05655, partial [Syntrophothermus sp.]